MTIDERIARYIIAAQAGSDSGKGIRGETGARKNVIRGAVRYGYTAKLPYLMNALRLLKTNKKSMFRWYVKQEDDQNGYDSILVYFNFHIDGKPYQISFHTPYNLAPPELLDMVGKGTPTHWRRNPNSRESTRELVKKFHLEKELSL